MEECSSSSLDAGQHTFEYSGGEYTKLENLLEGYVTAFESVLIASLSKPFAANVTLTQVSNRCSSDKTPPESKPPCTPTPALAEVRACRVQIGMDGATDAETEVRRTVEVVRERVGVGRAKMIRNYVPLMARQLLSWRLRLILSSVVRACLINTVKTVQEQERIGYTKPLSGQFWGKDAVQMTECCLYNSCINSLIQHFVCRTAPPYSRGAKPASLRDPSTCSSPRSAKLTTWDCWAL